jgi:hypothetical protein
MADLDDVDLVPFQALLTKMAVKEDSKGFYKKQVVKNSSANGFQFLCKMAGNKSRASSIFRTRGDMPSLCRQHLR